MIVEQAEFFEQERIEGYGPLGGAHTRPILVRVRGRNPGLYVAKRYQAASPYMMIAEAVCADLASLLGLPIPIRTAIEYESHLWLGSHHMPLDSKPLIPEKLDKLVNPGDIAGILAFDVLVCNWDRHEGNLILQRESPTMDRYRLKMIDHSVALGGRRRNIEEWIVEDKETTRYLEKPTPLLGRIESLEDFDPICTKLEALTAEEVSQVISSVPREWRPPQDNNADLLSDFLIQRAAKVRQLLHEASACFPSICE